MTSIFLGEFGEFLAEAARLLPGDEALMDSPDSLPAKAEAADVGPIVGKSTASRKADTRGDVASTFTELDTTTSALVSMDEDMDDTEPLEEDLLVDAILSSLPWVDEVTEVAEDLRTVTVS